MKVRYFLLLLAGLLVAQFSFAQTQRTVGGRVYDENGEPVAGASIVEKGTRNGTSSDKDGRFSISVRQGASLEVVFLGYETATVPASGDGPLDIRLRPEVTNIDDVVVVGYRTVRKESLTGAVANITGGDIITSKSPSLALNLAGKVAGFNVRQQSGQPGVFDTSINIRGLGKPLFIIDGIVKDDATEFQKLNPEDIESISFLKDGTAAIYGMNSSNGAVIVTTRKGSRTRQTIEFSTNFGFTTPTEMPLMCNAAQWNELMVDAQVNIGNSPYITEEEVERWREGGEGYESYNYYDELFKSFSTRQQHTLSVSGGNDKVTFYTSLGYVYDNGLLRKGDISWRQYSLRSNIRARIASNLTVDFNMDGALDSRRQGAMDYSSLFFVSIVEPPVSSIYANDNSDYYNVFTYGINPVAGSDEDVSGYYRANGRRFQTTISMIWSTPFVKGLDLKAQVSYVYGATSAKRLGKEFYLYTYDAGAGEYNSHLTNSPSNIRQTQSNSDRVDAQLSASWKRIIAGKHDLGAVLVFEGRRLTGEDFGGFRYYDLYTIDDLNYGRTKDMTNSGSSWEENYLSYIGRFNYGYKDKYLAELAFRYDGSYRYSKDGRWAFFPMGSVGWKISEEDFIKYRLPWVNLLKIRASYGVSGQDAGNAFQYMEGYTLNSGGTMFSADTYTSGIKNGGLTNKNLTWYTSKMADIGIDWSLWEGKFGGEFDLFRRDRSGLLATRNVSLPNTFGATLAQENLNKDRTQGLDMTLSHTNNIRDFYYTVKANVCWSRHRTVYAEESNYSSSYSRWRSQSTGRWQNIVWGYQTDGRFLTEDDLATLPIQDGQVGNQKELPGDYIIKDVNGDGHIDSSDMLPCMWGGTPLVNYGLTFSASWKGLDLNVLFQGAGCYTVRYMDCYGVMLYQLGNTPAYFMDRWHYANPYDTSKGWVEGYWPAIRPDTNYGTLYYTTDVWRRNATYLRLKSVELGYTLPDSLTKKVGIGSLRVYVNGNNLLTFCDKFVKAFDPEKTEGTSSAGISYPLTKCISIGANLSF